MLLVANCLAGQPARDLVIPILAGHHQDSISNPPELSDSKEALWGREQPLQQNVYQVMSAQDCTVISCHLDAMHSCGRQEQCAWNAGALHKFSAAYGPDPRFFPAPTKKKNEVWVPETNSTFIHSQASFNSQGHTNN